MKVEILSLIVREHDGKRRLASDRNLLPGEMMLMSLMIAEVDGEIRYHKYGCDMEILTVRTLQGKALREYLQLRFKEECDAQGFEIPL